MGVWIFLRYLFFLIFIERETHISTVILLLKNALLLVCPLRFFEVGFEWCAGPLKALLLLLFFFFFFRGKEGFEGWWWWCFR